MTKSTDKSLIEDTEIPPEELVKDLAEDQEDADSNDDDDAAAEDDDENDDNDNLSNRSCRV